MFVFLMIRRPPRSTRTDTLIPYTTLFRSEVTLPPGADAGQARSAINALQQGLVIDSPADDTLRVSFTEAALRQRTNAVMAQSVEVMRRRIDETGAREASIQRHGDRKRTRLNSSH